MSAFVPRASGIGAYFACDHRALLDRQRAEGTLDYEVKDSLNMYAALGTVAHYILQRQLNCNFPTPDKDAYAPSPEEYNVAAQFTGGCRDKLHAHASAIAALAAEHMPPVTGVWHAEPAFEAFNLTGHIDFLSPDLRTIVDLKTTQRKPDHNRIKPGHLYQLMAYRRLVEMTTGTSPATGYVLYADAKSAKWALLLPFDFTSPQAAELAVTVDKYLTYLLSPVLATAATPRMGNTCSGDYCPYTPICRDKYIPPSGTVSTAPAESVTPSCGEVF